ncbi:MAG TPA: NADP-dependent oxidoreductase [Candidatus Acidoferrales bacterium]|nr:NADP-dependent oxidoreductase [Candidatus Acidoferrales bacterium]
MNKRVLLARRPEGEPVDADFCFVEEPVPALDEGQVRLRTRYLSLDPYMRGRMSAVRSYAKSVEIGEMMVGGAVSEVVDSKNPAFHDGDFVFGYTGWQTEHVSSADGLRKLDPNAAPLTYALGVLGMPGQTAYCALLDIGKPQPGETVVVSSAAGAVGSVAGQIAKIKGARVVGVAGSDEKCRYVVEQLGFDACINRRAERLDKALKTHCPDGIDIYYDNTGGPILHAVMRQLRLHARIAIVGMIDQYNAVVAPPGPNLRPMLTMRATMQGFLVSDHQAHTPAFERDVGTWLREGKIRYREDVVEGLENAPRALIGMLRGENFGKLIVKV